MVALVWSEAVVRRRILVAAGLFAVALGLPGSARADTARTPRPAAAAAAVTSQAALGLVAGQGGYDGSVLTLAPGEAGCAGRRFAASFTVESSGGLATPSVTARIDGLPAGSIVSIVPAVLSLEPGERGDFRATVDLLESAPAGTLTGTLDVSDGAAGASAGAPVRVTRCEVEDSSLRIEPATGSEMVFEPGPGGCSLRAFHARFRLVSTGNGALLDVRPALASLPPGARVTFTPAGVALEPGAEADVDAALLIDAATPPGSYPMTLVAADAASGASATAPARVTACSAPGPSLAILPADGQGSLAFLPGAAGCSGSEFTLRFVVAAAGQGALGPLAPVLDLGSLPAGSRVLLSPPSVTLRPGERATFTASLTLAGGAGAGRHAIELAVRDAVSLAEARAEASLLLCVQPRPEIFIVLPGGGRELVLAPGASGCSGTAFHGEFEVEAGPLAAMASVRPRLDGLPAGSSVRFRPESAAVAAASRARFEVDVTLAEGEGAGRIGASLSATDAASGVVARMAASLTRCAAPVPGLALAFEGGAPELVLAPSAGGGCDGTLFAGRFTATSTGETQLEGVTSVLTGFPEGSRVSFEPRAASIPAGASVAFAVTVELPGAAEPARYAAALAVADKAGSARATGTASLTRCDGTARGLRLRFDGDAAELVLAAGPEGCSGSTWSGSFLVEALGPDPVEGVRPSLLKLPAGSSVTLVPEVASVTPGAPRRFQVTLTLGAAIAPGSYAATLVAREPSKGIEATGTARFVRCDAARAGLRIEVEPRAPGVVLAPSGSCAADAFTARVAVVNTGQRALDAVMLSLTGFPGALRATIEPARLALPQGTRGTFEVRVAGASALAAGTYVAGLTARDAVTAAFDSAALQLVRCAGPAAGDVDPPPLPGDEHGATLAIAQSASKGAVRAGEVLTIVVRLTNAGAGAARGVVVEEELPRGFVHAKGRTALDGVAFDDPQGAQRLSWTVPEVPAGDETVLAFQVVALPSAERGTATFRAWARAAGTGAGPAEARVEVTAGGFRPFGEVRGLVRYAAGGGAARVRLLLDSDREARTDADGRFSFGGVLGGDHLVTVDARTLAPGDRLAVEDSQFLHLFDGSTEDVEFLLMGPPQIGIQVSRVEHGPAETETK